MVNKMENSHYFNIKRSDLRRVPDNINFAREEELILKYWQEKRVFEQCMQFSAGRPKYTFYDGPPFATGLPHYGHILAGTIKDIVTRYAYQQGYHVERRFGWDCHGLPVEYEIDKMLDIKGPQDVQAMGIAAYNAECRKIVMRYADEWQTVISRMGRWVDFQNDYKTLYPWYMESIWWVFKQLYDKGLVYESIKVMPYSTGCNTPLSNFESGENYKVVSDPCVYIAMELVDQPGTHIIIWTTTPWTLPSNFACCVNPNLTYVKVENLEDKRFFILAESRLTEVFTKDLKKEYRIVDKFLGKTLEGLKYKPLFDYFVERAQQVDGFRVLCDNYVTEGSGTGIVHNAPYFGEDDYRVCLQAQLITKISPVMCPVDESGCFTSQVSHFAGKYVKEADKHIIEHLRAQGNLILKSTVDHSYPYCWRSDTPLIYKAVPSWFIRVEHMSEQLLQCSGTTYWVPEFVKDKRFGNWLKDARDWAVSRNRYWGTPIPIWSNGEGEIVCIGSIRQLQELSGVLIEDLHRESIDHITIPSKRPNGKPLQRICAVFDCWFESGSMPFAQQHYPFDEKRSKDFLQNFPADFIAEGIDQTRGWFYTLLVISTALFNQAPYKNLIANGLILAADGQKMSKRKKNYPDPMTIVQKYGADALRLYLINSPVVRAENLRFKEDGVRDIIKDVFLPWYNSYRFLLQNIARFEIEELGANDYYYYDNVRHLESMDNASIMDVWIISFKESLLEFFAQEMALYHLYTVVPRLTKFIDQLTNWYIRLNRLRIKGEFGKDECIKSLDTLYDVLFAIVKIMAPFTPFLAEHIYQRLVLFQKRAESDGESSVHLEVMPKCNVKLVRPDVEKCVTLMQSVIELGRIMRDRRTWPIKYPVREIIVIHRDTLALEQIKSMENIILSELNARKMTLSSDRQKYGITMRAEPDHKLLGQRLKSSFKAVMSGLKSLSNDDIQDHVARGYFEIAGERVEMDEVRIKYVVAADMGEHFEAHSDNDVLVLMDMQQDVQLLDEGLAREIINRVQKLKKKADLIPSDVVTIYYEFMANSSKSLVTNGGEKIVDNEQMSRVISTHYDMIVNTVKSAFKSKQQDETHADYELISELVEIRQFQMKLTICSKTKPIKKNVPSNNYLNIILANDIDMRFKGNKSTDDINRQGCLFLQNGGRKLCQLIELRREIEIIYGLYGINFNMMFYNNTKTTWMTLKTQEDFLGYVGGNNQNNLLFITRHNLPTQYIILLQQKLQLQQPNVFCQFKETTTNENHEIMLQFIENPKGISLKS